MTTNIESPRDDIASILTRPTIRRVNRACQNLCEQKDLPQFQRFVEEESEFILTDRRESILEGISHRLRDEESPGVILYGSYGSGKTVLMNTVAELCQSSRTIDGNRFEQLRYGETPIDCFTISLQDHDSPFKFLKQIYDSLLTAEELNQTNLKSRFEANKDELTLEAFESLPEQMRKNLKETFDDPDTTDDIAKAVKSLSASNAHDTISWFAQTYYDATGAYPAFYIDEFEQTFRGLDPDEERRLKNIVKKMMRASVDTHETLAQPPYILFVNSVGLTELDETIQAEEDLVSRLQDEESISYSINLSDVETKNLFRRLYHIYAEPLVSDYSDDVSEWYERLSSAGQDDDDFAYPFTESALDYIIDVVDVSKDKSRDANVVTAFRAYKNALIAFFELWDGTGRIDRDFLYRHGDEARERIAGLERADESEIPGQNSIEEQIEEDFSEHGIGTRKVIVAAAQEAILDRDSNPAIFSSDELETLASDVEVDLTMQGGELVTEVVDSSIDYLEKDGEYLVLDRQALTGAATNPEVKAMYEKVQEAVDEHNLTKKSLTELWYKALTEELATEFDIQDEGNYFEIDVKGEYNYTSRIYLSFSSDQSTPPTHLQQEVSSKAFHVVAHLGPNNAAEDDPDAHPARFHVSERNGRASNRMDKIESELNDKLDAHLDSDAGTSTLLENIADAYPHQDEFHNYRLFLKLSLVEVLGNKLAEGIVDRTAEKRVFFPPRYVAGGINNLYSDYVPEYLGFDDNYTGNEILDLIYGIKHLRECGELIYQNPGIFDIRKQIREITGIEPGNRAGEQFIDLLDKLSDEQFLSAENGDYDIVGIYSENMQTRIDEIDGALKKAGEEGDQELTFDEITEELFGTKEIESVSEAYLYLIVTIVDLVENPFVLTEKDSKIVYPDYVLERHRKQTKETITEAIKREALLRAREEKIEDTERLEELLAKYESIADFDKDELEQLDNELKTEVTVEIDDLEQSVRGLAAKSVYEDTAISNYVEAVNKFGSMEAGLSFLLKQDLTHLVNQLKPASNILSQRNDIIEQAEKIEKAGGQRPDINAPAIEISCISAIQEHLKSHDVESEIDDVSLAEDIDNYIEGTITATTLIESLQRTRRAVVPRVDEYTPDEHKEQLSSDQEKLQDRFSELIDRLDDDIEAAREQLQEYRSQVPEGEQALVRRGDRHLENLEAEIDKNIESFDAVNYNTLWEDWTKTENEIAEVALDEEDIEKVINEFGAEIEPETVTQATPSLDEIFQDVNDQEEFSKFVEGLSVDSTVAPKLQAAMIKKWLNKQQNDTEDEQ